MVVPTFWGGRRCHAVRRLDAELRGDPELLLPSKLVQRVPPDDWPPHLDVVEVDERWDSIVIVRHGTSSGPGSTARATRGEEEDFAVAGGLSGLGDLAAGALTKVEGHVRKSTLTILAGGAGVHLLVVGRSGGRGWRGGGNQLYMCGCLGNFCEVCEVIR